MASLENNNNNNNKEINESPAQIEDEEMFGCEIICCNRRTKRRPIPCMQVFNNAKGLLVFLCLALFLEGVINAGFYNAVIGTVEKRFQIQSTESGVIASAFDIFTCCALVYLAFSGERAFKPLWLGWGTLIMGIGCVLYALPHFTAPEYTFEVQDPALCGSNSTNHKCTGSNIRNYMYLFFFANGLIGLGSAPLFTLAITYIDESVKKKNSALYGGIYYAMGAIGPAAGYLLGGALLSVYTYVGVQPKGITPGSSLWIGSWWSGFLIAGFLSVLLSFFIMMFPKNLPGTQRFRTNRNTEVHHNKASERATENEDFGKSWKDAPKVIWLLVTNVPYVSLTLSSCINYSFVYGFNTFGAKYISSVFGVSTTVASLGFGIAAIFGAAGGQFFGGFTITKLQLTVSGILKFMIICTAVCMVATFGFLLHCKNTGFVGPTEGGITPNCGTGCSCSSDMFEPVCGEDGKSYFSACYAGCDLQVNESYFSNCSCTVESTNLTIAEGSGWESSSLGFGARAGECLANDCNMMVPFLVLVFVAMFSTIMKTTPNLQATIRCIPFHLRTSAVSLQRLVFTLLGTIPGRIITGKIIDLSCISWGTECGNIGACRAYDTEQASKNMTMLLIIQMFVCLVLQIVTLAIYKPVKSHEDESPHRTEDVVLDDVHVENSKENTAGQGTQKELEAAPRESDQKETKSD